MPVWFGKWYFKNIPEQLYGQNFAFTSLDGGLLKFDVSKVSGRNLNQRIWLLIPHQDWDGSRTTSIPHNHQSQVFATSQGLIAFGWSAWNDMTSEHVQTRPDQPLKTMKWSVFYRDAKPGEEYRVRTHWKHTPMLVWGSTQLDNVIVEPEWDQRVAVFEPGATVPLGNGHLVLEHVPEAINGRLFTKRNGYQGAARFRVTSDQKVTVAMYEWGHEHDGNASGNWMPELTSRRKMVEQGWEEAGEVRSRHSDPKQSGANWFLYTRDCKAGESFLLRNHKYQAPLVFSEKTYFEDGPIDVDPPAMEELERRQAEERLALLVEQFNSMFKQKRYAEAFVIALQTKRKFPSSPVADLMLSKSQSAIKAADPDSATDTSDGSADPVGFVQEAETNTVRPDAIRLDASSLRIQLANEVGEPAVFGTHGAGVENVNLPELFLSRQTELPRDGWIARDGYGLLLGQIPVMAHPDDRFELERFERTGNQVRVVFRQYATSAELDQSELSKEATDRRRSLYFGTPLPVLPPGAYEVTAEIQVLQHPGEADDPVSGTTDTSETKLDQPASTPTPRESITLKGRFTVSGADQDAAELKRLAVLAIVTKPVGHGDVGRAMSSPLNMNISELITRAGQLQDVLELPKEPEDLRGFLDNQRQAGNRWAMCAALEIENPDSKIVAAKALTKLADPDTVSVLLIAAKRNAYAVTGSENATLHLIFQTELTRALEAATGLKLSKAGLTMNVPALGPATGEALDEITNLLSAGTGFAKVDTWLRNVYLADTSSLVPTEKPESNATPAAGGIPVPHTSHLGLIGRLAMQIVSSGSPSEPSNPTHFDPGYIYQYVPGQFFHRDVLPLDLTEDHRFVVTLNGQLVVPHDMVAKIWHAGGGVSHDQCRLYVDDRLLGVVGDNTDKHKIYEVPLLKGCHDIRWELTGGTFRTNMLVVQDSETGQRIEIVNPGPESLRQSLEDKVVQIQSSRPDWPVSAKAGWLPETVVITEAD